MKHKLFYGWYIVVGGLIVAAVNSAVMQYGWSAFVNPIVATFGWSMTQLSLATSLRGLETGVFNPMWGVAVDRYSPRKLMIFGTVFTAAGIFLLSQTRNLAMYYVGFLIIGVSTSLTTSVLPTTLLTRWFKKDLGKANGLFFMGVGLGGVLVPIVTFLIDQSSWQTVLLYTSIASLVLGIGCSFIFRRRPEDYNMVPDGKVDTQKSASGKFQTDFGMSIRDVIKTRTFWHISVMLVFQYATMSPITLYTISYLTGLGVDRTKASLVISIYTFVSLFVRIPLGILADVIKTKYIFAATGLLMGIGVVFYWLIGPGSSFLIVILFSVIYGLGLGGVNVLRPSILAEYFGRKHFGAIFGFASVFVTIGTIVSTPVAGWIFDTFHTYKPYWLAMVVFAAIAVVLMLTIPPSKVKTETKLRAVPTSREGK